MDIYYSMLIFSPPIRKQWLPQLPPDEIRDTGIRGAGLKKDLTAKERIKKYRKRKREDDESVAKRNTAESPSDLSTSCSVAAR